MPPSKDNDPGKTPPPAKPQRGGGGAKREPGKQPGAPGANLAWTDNPTTRVDRFPTGRRECGHDLSDTLNHGGKPGERKARALLEALCDRPEDVVRFAYDPRVPPTSNQAERDLRPAKIQQRIFGRLTSGQRAKDRHRVLGYLSTAVKHGRDMMDALRGAILGRPRLPPDSAPA
jgi:Transposase IS66 family